MKCGRTKVGICISRTWVLLACQRKQWPFQGQESDSCRTPQVGLSLTWILALCHPEEMLGGNSGSLTL